MGHPQCALNFFFDFQPKMSISMSPQNQNSQPPMGQEAKIAKMKNEDAQLAKITYSYVGGD